MGLKCRISYTADNTAIVRDSSGELSTLFPRIMELMNDQKKALDMYATAVDELQGEDTSMDALLKYLDSAQAEDNSLSPSEGLEVRDFMSRNNIASLSELYQTMTRILKPNGTLQINTSEAIASGLYSRADLENLDLLKVGDIMSKIEGELSRSDFFVEAGRQGDYYTDPTRRTLFGSSERLLQSEIDQAIENAVEDFTDEVDLLNQLQELPFEGIAEKFEEDAEYAKALLKKLENLKKIPRLSVVNGELNGDNNHRYVTILNTVLSNTDTIPAEAELDYLREIDVEVWHNNHELIKETLRGVEKTMAQVGLDVVGISQIPHQRVEIIGVINSGIKLLKQRNGENVADFANKMESLVPSEGNAVTENLPSKYAGYNIVSLKSNENSNNLFKEFGLLKIGEDLFHKVEQNANVNDIIEFLYQEVVDGRLKVPLRDTNLDNKISALQDISSFLMTKDTGSQYDNHELVAAYQVAFNHSPVKAVRADKLSSITTNERYLKTGFVSDFYKYTLEEKVKDSGVYRSTLSKFEFGDNDISLSSGLASIEGLKFEKELGDYIALKRSGSMDHLISSRATFINNDLEVLNNPEIIKEFQGDYVLHGDHVITPQKLATYVKVGNQLFRKSLSKDGLDMYTKLTTPEDNVYNTNSLNFKFDKTEAKKIFANYDNVTPSTIDHTQYSNIIAKSKITDYTNANLKEFSRLKDSSYSFFEVNDAIVAYRNGQRVGSYRLNRVANGYKGDSLGVSNDHQGQGIGQELVTRAILKANKEGKTFYGSDTQTQAAKSVTDKVDAIVNIAEDGGRTLKEEYGGPPTTIAYRTGDLITKAEPISKFKNTSRGTGHFGTGFYFFGKKSDAESYSEQSGNRSISEVNLGDYNLAKGTADLHTALKEINDTTEVSSTMVREAAKAVGVATTVENPYKKYLPRNSAEDKALRERYSEKALSEFSDKANKFEKDNDKASKIADIVNNQIGKRNNEDTASTLVMKEFGFEGVDSTNTGLDNSTYGTVIYDIKPAPSKNAETIANIENHSTILDSRLEIVSLYNSKEEGMIKNNIDECKG